VDDIIIFYTYGGHNSTFFTLNTKEELYLCYQQVRKAFYYLRIHTDVKLLNTLHKRNMMSGFPVQQNVGSEE